MITRPPPPSGRPPAYAVAGRAFGRTDLRPIVIVSTVTSIVWSLIWAAGAFEDISGEKQSNDLKQLVTFDIVIGSLYSAVAASEFFGLLAAITRRASLARIYVGLSLIVILLVGTAELLRTVVHFKFKDDIINGCITDSTTRGGDSGSGFWGGSTGDLLRPNEAREFCNDTFNRMSFSTIAWLILGTLFSLFFASSAYSFYRQLLDPNTFRAPRAPSDQVRLDALRHQQQQPYGGGYMPYPGFNNYAPPPGPPPGMGGYAVPPYESGRLPGYGTEFAARDVGDEKDGDKMGGDPFTDHARLDAGPSETDLTHRV